MNEIEKEIEEMARIIKTANEINCIRTCDNCEYYADDIKCISFGQAIALYNAGYRNIKDKVVLSKEEQERILNATEKRIKQLKKELKQASELKAETIRLTKQETARDIIEMLTPPCENCDENWHKGCLCLRAKIAEKIAKQYGVEVE
jgi:hypothetical protein